MLDAYSGLQLVLARLAYDYFEVFPNVKLTYRLNPANRVIAAYNRRVDRPGEPELRIFPKYDDPELLKVGNPFLRPQFTNAFELGLGRSWQDGSLSTALYYRDIKDSFFRVFAIDDSNPNYDIVNRIFENAGNSAQTGVEVLLEHEIGEPWRVSGGVNWYQNDIDAFETLLFFPTPRPFALAASSDDTWDVTLNNQLQLPSAIELQLSYIYYAERNVPQGREKARSSVDLAATWPLMDERAELLFTFTDMNLTGSELCHQPRLDTTQEARLLRGGRARVDACLSSGPARRGGRVSTTGDTPAKSPPC